MAIELPAEQFLGCISSAEPSLLLLRDRTGTVLLHQLRSRLVPHLAHEDGGKAEQSAADLLLVCGFDLGLFRV